MAYLIKHFDALEAEVRRIAHEEVRNALREIRNAGTRPDPVHATRLHCKKMRALLRLVRHGLGRHYEVENESCRDIARSLSGPRDAKIILTTIDTLLEDHAYDTAELDGEHLRAWLVSRLDPLRKEAEHTGALVESLVALTSIEARIPRWRVRGAPIRILSAGVGETYKRARHDFRRVRETRRASHFHDWRKHVKYHWLQLKLIRPIGSKALPGRMKRMTELSRALGDLHDLDVLEPWLARQHDHAAAASLAVITQRLGRRRAELQRAAIALGEHQFARPPRELVEAIVRRLSATARRTP